MFSLVCFGAAAVWLTEILGALNLLRRGPLLAGWALVAVMAAVRRRPLASRPHRPGWLDLALLAGACAVVLPVGLVALASAPNSTDALGYHLPRVIYWAQQASVRFFPTGNFQQLTHPPMAEYLMLHTYLIAGNDHFVNLVQFLGFCGSIVVVWNIARVLGAQTRGCAIAAVFCATLPGAILQASGVKNDCVLSLWLAAMVYFALRWTRDPAPRNLAALALSLGLALFTKGTAYLLAPPVLAALLARTPRRLLPRLLGVLALGVVLVNGPHYLRNMDLSGSPLGFSSAGGDGRYRWAMDRFGLGPTLSNVMRHLSGHLSARSPAWNQQVYQAVLAAHAALGVDVNDPATTWPYTRFQAPANSNHEAAASNRWHFLLALAVIPALWLVRDRSSAVWYYAGLAGAFVLFCAVLRWQLYMHRLYLPLFILAAPVAGLLAGRFLHPLLQVALCILLLDGAKPYVLENWTRPLKGPASVLKMARSEGYFSDLKHYADPEDYRRSVAAILESGCRRVGIDTSWFDLEYPLQALLRGADASYTFVHSSVRNVSARYAQPGPAPCAVVCLQCLHHPEKREEYRTFSRVVEAGTFLVFLEARQFPQPVHALLDLGRHADQVRPGARESLFGPFPRRVDAHL